MRIKKNWEKDVSARRNCREFKGHYPISGASGQNENQLFMPHYVILCYDALSGGIMGKNKESIFDFKTELMIDVLAEYLGIPVEKRKLIYLSELRCDENAGLITPCYNKKSEISSMHIMVNTKDQDVREQLLALCHEMIHARQYLLGEVVRVYKKNANGKSKKIRMVRKYLKISSEYRIEEKTYNVLHLGNPVPNLHDINGPLEAEAYGREEELLEFLTKQKFQEEPEQLYDQAA